MKAKTEKKNSICCATNKSIITFSEFLFIISIQNCCCHNLNVAKKKEPFWVWVVEIFGNRGSCSIMKFFFFYLLCMFVWMAKFHPFFSTYHTLYGLKSTEQKLFSFTTSNSNFTFLLYFFICFLIFTNRFSSNRMALKQSTNQLIKYCNCFCFFLFQIYFAVNKFIKSQFVKFSWNLYKTFDTYQHYRITKWFGLVESNAAPCRLCIKKFCIRDLSDVSPAYKTY